jgi:hypothetical protein
MKNISIAPLLYEMLLETSKGMRKKPEALLEELIKQAYLKRQQK